jgi:hypothetical protein
LTVGADPAHDRKSFRNPFIVRAMAPRPRWIVGIALSTNSATSGRTPAASRFPTLVFSASTRDVSGLNAASSCFDPSAITPIAAPAAANAGTATSRLGPRLATMSAASGTAAATPRR